MPLLGRPPQLWVKATLIVPRGVHKWTPLLRQLSVVQTLELPCHSGFYGVGAAAPPQWRRRRPIFLLDVHWLWLSSLL